MLPRSAAFRSVLAVLNRTTYSRNTMSSTAPPAAPFLPTPNQSAGEQLVALGWQINANQYQAVYLAAEYDRSLEWLGGYKNAAQGIAKQLDINTVTAREWIRVGHALPYLPLIDTAFCEQSISYAKARILTRYADADNEQELLDLALERNADRLTIAIAKVLAQDEDDNQRDQRLFDYRSCTTYTNADGMTVIRIVLPPEVAKPVVTAIDETVRRIAQTPTTTPEPSKSTTKHAPADAYFRRSVVDPTNPTTESDQTSQPADPLVDAPLQQLRQRWQRTPNNDWYIPTYAQQRADAFMTLFLHPNINLTTEIVLHVRGDGNTLDDGTPLTNNAITRQLDHSFIRLLIHGINGKPIDATNKRRYPTTRQKRVVAETHNHQCKDCNATHLPEYDHNPPHEQTGHTITTELELRCAPCHRARHHRENLTKAA